MSKVFAVIMAGGSGTRFWPASRARRPKQLLPLLGTEQTMLAATVERLSPLIEPTSVYVVTGAPLAAATREALPRVPAAQILSEPAARNTAPCIAWASATVARTDPDAVLAVLPADHHIGDEPAFRAVLAQAIDVARSGRVATVGVVPTRPETGYGYIELGDPIGAGDARAVARFVEKPDRARAEAYVAGGRHLWNAGMFFFRAKDMLSLVREHLPELADGVARIDAAAARGDEAAALAEIFPSLPKVSIDHGVMEKAKGLAVVPGSFGWNDVGSWQSAWELASKDADGNALPEGAVAIEARDNIVKLLDNPKKAVALLGVSDLIVVDTGDALLVMPRERAQDVRDVVDALGKANRADVL